MTTDSLWESQERKSSIKTGNAKRPKLIDYKTKLHSINEHEI